MFWEQGIYGVAEVEWSGKDEGSDESRGSDESSKSKSSSETNGHVEFKQMVQSPRAGGRAYGCVVWKQDHTNMYSECRCIQLPEPSHSDEQRRSISLQSFG